MAGGSLTVFHASDFQCGKPFLPHAADAMLRLAEEIGPDVVVASGDLTQRAKIREYSRAREILDRFGDVPVVVTPGNHDVPLYRIWERLATPYRNWHRFAGPDLDTVLRVEGATFVALNSSAPRRAIVNGRIDDHQLDFARRAFAESPAGDLKLLVIHHHFVSVPDGKGGHPLPRAAHLGAAFEEMEVDAVLGGHVHQLHLRSTADLCAPADGHSAVPLLACGTTTSRRGRGPEAGWNSLCVLRFESGAVQVTPFKRRPDGDRFEALEPRTFALTARSADPERVG